MKIIALSGLAGASLLLASCDVEKTQEGEMPDVDVQGGQLPKYDVDAPDVDVDMKEKDITIPVPDIDINPPDEDDDPDVPRDDDPAPAPPPGDQ